MTGPTITDVTAHLLRSDAPLEGYGVSGWLLVRVHTDDGVVGVGESGAWGYQEAAAAAVETFADVLEGEDALRREHLYQYCYRNAHFRGAVVTAALSAIDVALWDVAGKTFDASVADLLAGRCRESARVYCHAFGGTTDELVGQCEVAAEAGFTAIGHLSPLLDESREDRYFETHAERVRTARERVRRYREAVGDDVDLCIELHRRLDPHDAAALASKLEPFDPLFLEDPVKPDSFDSMVAVAKGTSLPIATGERLHTPHEFAHLLERGAVDFVRPDVGLCGGITGTKKIAAIAEAHDAAVVPHNPLGPVSTAQSLQVAAAVPNATLVEYPYRPDIGRAPSEALIEEEFERDGGFLTIPDGPGLGVTIDEEELAAAEAAYEPREFSTRLHRDGSVVDQ
jgi:galactonate dehydratase